MDKEKSLVNIDKTLPAKIEDIDISNEVLESYPEELKDKIILSPEDKKQLHDKFSKLDHGAYAEIPILCRGPECPYKDICPLYEKHISPYQLDPVTTGRCPIEIAAVKLWTQKWAEALQADSSDFTEIYMIRDLVEAEIIQMRANKHISINGFIKEIVVKTDPITGTAYKNYDISVPMEVKLKFKTFIYKILDKFIATRESKIKWKLASMKVKNNAVEQLAAKIKNGEITISSEE